MNIRKFHLLCLGKCITSLVSNHLTTQIYTHTLKYFSLFLALSILYFHFLYSLSLSLFLLAHIVSHNSTTVEYGMSLVLTVEKKQERKREASSVSLVELVSSE